MSDTNLDKFKPSQPKPSQVKPNKQTMDTDNSCDVVIIDRSNNNTNNSDTYCSWFKCNCVECCCDCNKLDSYNCDCDCDLDD